MSRAGGTEKRKHPRVRARQIAANVRIGDEGTACLLEDISRGGLFLRTERPLPKGTALVITLMKPGTRKGLQVSGRVARTITGTEAKTRGVSAGVGIAFDPLESEVAWQLEDLIRDLAFNDPEPQSPPEADDKPKLLMQINGLLFELQAAQEALAVRDREISDLKEQLRRALVDVSVRDAKIIKLEKTLAAPPTQAVKKR